MTNDHREPQGELAPQTITDQKPQTVIHYQTFDGTQVGGGTIRQPGRVDLHTATTLARLDAAPGVSVDLTSVITPDGRELVTE